MYVNYDCKVCTLVSNGRKHSAHRPVECHSGVQETIITGPITTSFRMHPDRAIQSEETWVWVSPHHLTRGLGSAVSSPSVVAENGFYAYLRSEKATWKRFSVFLSGGGALQTSCGAGKLPPSPLSTGLSAQSVYLLFQWCLQKMGTGWRMKRVCTCQEFCCHQRLSHCPEISITSSSTSTQRSALHGATKTQRRVLVCCSQVLL